MFRWLYSIFLMVILTVSVSAVAKNTPVTAVDIDVISDGRGIDGQAINKVRRISGNALASGVVDVFVVKAPKKGGPIFIEGGLSACAEVGFSSTVKTFNQFIKKLRAIHPKAGTTINVQATTGCINAAPPTMCGGIANIQCPSSSQICVDNPNDSCDPNNGGADCSGICKAK